MNDAGLTIECVPWFVVLLFLGLGIGIGYMVRGWEKIK